MLIKKYDRRSDQIDATTPFTYAFGGFNLAFRMCTKNLLLAFVTQYYTIGVTIGVTTDDDTAIIDANLLIFS